MRGVPVGARLALYWADDRRWYNGTVSAVHSHPSTSTHTIKYDDGDEEDVDLSREKVHRLVETNSGWEGELREMVESMQAQRKASRPTNGESIMYSKTPPYSHVNLINFQLTTALNHPRPRSVEKEEEVVDPVPATSQGPIVSKSYFPHLFVCSSQSTHSLTHCLHYSTHCLYQQCLNLDLGNLSGTT